MTWTSSIRTPASPPPPLPARPVDAQKPRAPPPAAPPVALPSAPRVAAPPSAAASVTAAAEGLTGLSNGGSLAATPTVSRHSGVLGQQPSTHPFPHASQRSTQLLQYPQEYSTRRNTASTSQQQPQRSSQPASPSLRPQQGSAAAHSTSRLAPVTDATSRLGPGAALTATVTAGLAQDPSQARARLEDIEALIAKHLYASLRDGGGGDGAVIAGLQLASRGAFAPPSGAAPSAALGEGALRARRSAGGEGGARAAGEAGAPQRPASTGRAWPLGTAGLAAGSGGGSGGILGSGAGAGLATWGGHGRGGAQRPAAPATTLPPRPASPALFLRGGALSEQRDNIRAPPPPDRPLNLAFYGVTRG
jgi:hypothetical protein